MKVSPLCEKCGKLVTSDQRFRLTHTPGVEHIDCFDPTRGALNFEFPVQGGGPKQAQTEETVVAAHTTQPPQSSPRHDEAESK
jgi:hypothetical protein